MILYSLFVESEVGVMIILDVCIHLLYSFGSFSQVRIIEEQWGHSLQLCSAHDCNCKMVYMCNCHHI